VSKYRFSVGFETGTGQTFVENHCRAPELRKNRVKVLGKDVFLGFSAAEFPFNGAREALAGNEPCTVLCALDKRRELKARGVAKIARHEGANKKKNRNYRQHFKRVFLR